MFQYLFESYIYNMASSVHVMPMFFSYNVVQLCVYIQCHTTAVWCTFIYVTSSKNIEITSKNIYND